MIVFRVDGNSNIGLGHIMRCLSIADAFQKMGKDCLFVTSDNAPSGIIKNRGYNFCTLDSQSDSLDAETSDLIGILKTIDDVELVIIDSYYVTKRYLQTIKDNYKLVYIDDILSFDYPVDIVINYNIFASTMAYKKLYAGSNTVLPKLILGPKFVPLRDQFIDVIPITISDNVSRVLVSTGGADKEHIAVGLIDYICGHNELKKYNYEFVVGAMNSDKQIILDKIVGLDNITVHSNVADMSALMRTCDIAVSASGSTLYELCACGLPTITYVVADNQIVAAEQFDKQGIMIDAGDCRDDENFTNKLFAIVEELSSDKSKREKLSASMQELVDGNGAKRIVDELLLVL